MQEFAHKSTFGESVNKPSWVLSLIPSWSFNLSLENSMLDFFFFTTSFPSSPTAQTFRKQKLTFFFYVTSKLEIQLRTKPLTLPTRIGSGPENSSSTNIWFQTHPLLARWRTPRPSGWEVSLSELGLVSKLRDRSTNGAEEPKHTHVIHASKIRVHTSLCISSLRFGIFTVRLF